MDPQVIMPEFVPVRIWNNAFLDIQQARWYQGACRWPRKKSARKLNERN